LGRPVPCVGRERDLRSTLDYIDGGFEQSSARAILMVGPPGIGKSRLRLEIVDRVRDSVRNLFVISGRGDWLGVGSAFGLLGGALRGALGLDSAKSDAEQREKLLEATCICGEAERPRIAAFLGEMLGVHFPDNTYRRLCVARENPSVMAEGIQEAFVDFMRAKAAASPVLLVLEDLHWGDMPSTRLVDVMLRELSDLPIVVLALARPEVHEAFPGLWQGRAVQTIRLGRLSRKAAESMVNAILGDSVELVHVNAIVERADGNAFFIEELSRAVADGQSEALPDTIAGMVETRIMALPPALRLALRAASIFGRRFRPDGAAALIDQTLRNGAADVIFDELVDREFLERRSSSRQFGPEELAFRQALIQQAAYGMLTERDRMLGHLLAAEWLESIGEFEPMILAEHFTRGGEPARATGYYVGAARQALNGGDSRVALERVKQALMSGAEGETYATLVAIQSEAIRSSAPSLVLSHAEALFATNRMQEAKAVLGHLLSELLTQARAIRDPESRRVFWENVPMRSRAFELAKLWGLERA
jgi:eukaryotic-like serine/threonine-protein kinase